MNDRECARCNQSVWVPDCYEFEEGDMCMSCTKEELDSSRKLNEMLGKLLHDTANVLHGGPKENGLWSYHDVPELAEILKVENELMADWIRKRGGVTSHYTELAKEVINGPKSEPTV